MFFFDLESQIKIRNSHQLFSDKYLDANKLGTSNSSILELSRLRNVDFCIVTILDQTDVVLTSPPILGDWTKLKKPKSIRMCQTQWKSKLVRPCLETEIWRQIFSKESYCRICS